MECVPATRTFLDHAARAVEVGLLGDVLLDEVAEDLVHDRLHGAVEPDALERVGSEIDPAERAVGRRLEVLVQAALADLCIQGHGG